ncbi:diaminopimelate decarboxylase [Persephonella hydrogeniphila]|uniref:Diaminopimelate decarboxylase n=1 Tax=Persephonella hydrogeniphila TaxID=198703 RepID=A0A285NG81_9AQUI|nr:diaminopimelate decarboxylase [Persephonella hydrogeniphila]SNZ08459.1 diaminopimelate decarboxylase [Persephonella hydrogeniphila]
MEDSFSPYFHFVDNELYCEKTPVKKIAKEFGTPVYIYSKNAILEKIREYKEAFKEYPTLICYAAKANSNLSILKIFQEEGLGLDIVSGGELYRGLKAEFDPKKIVYAGVGKTDKELIDAIDTGILSFNVESLMELDVLDELSEKVGKKADISIRVNPDVNPKTHPYISTGLRKSKFGIDMEDALEAYKIASRKKNLNIVGIHCHIGSQIMDVSPYEEAVEKLVQLVFKLKREGIELRHIDIGGGLGIRYRPEDNPPHPKELAEIVIPYIKETGLKLLIEPGRSLVGEAGILVSQVLFLKDKGDKHFIIIDSGMNDLLRPAMYQAYHHILSVEKKKEKVIADIVGPICETGDFFALDREIDNLNRGDYLAVMSAGAYGFSMSSNYNTRPRAAEVLVDGENFYLIRNRESYQYIIQPEINEKIQGEVK